MRVQRKAAIAVDVFLGYVDALVLVLEVLRSPGTVPQVETVSP